MRKNKLDDLFSDNVETLQDCLAYLVHSFTKDKNHATKVFLSLPNNDDLISSLTNLFSFENYKSMSSNAVFILGNLVESEKGIKKMFNLINKKANNKILEDLALMLSSCDDEAVMNASGTLATLAESSEIRIKMTEDIFFDIILSNIGALLLNHNIWTSSNAALLLARLTITDEACIKLLNHKFQNQILHNLISSLGIDDAGRGTNSAFTVGRLLSVEDGKIKLLKISQASKMITSLCHMLIDGKLVCAKNACFAISCLAAIHKGCHVFMENELFTESLHRLIGLLSTADSEAAWFSAMALKTLSFDARGLPRLRSFNGLMSSLQNMEKKIDITKELQDEIGKTLKNLKDFGVPEKPAVIEITSNYILLSWNKLMLANDVIVVYKIFLDCEQVYKGTDLIYKIERLEANTEYKVKMKICVFGNDSVFSDDLIIVTDEGLPSAPKDLKLIFTSPTKLKFTWSPPASSNGSLLGYNILLDKKSLERTTDTNYVISRLQPSSQYLIEVSAFTSKENGEKAQLVAMTTELNFHAPSKPGVSVLGRNEMMVCWTGPACPIGRFFRYELVANGKVVYSGHDKSFHAVNLIPDTDYTFSICAITSEGRCESEVTKKRTHKHNKAPNERGRIKTKTFSFLAKETPHLLQRQHSEKLKTQTKKKKTRSKSTSALRISEGRSSVDRNEIYKSKRLQLPNCNKPAVKKVDSFSNLSFSPEEILLPIADDGASLNDANNRGAKLMFTHKNKIESWKNDHHINLNSSSSHQSKNDLDKIFQSEVESNFTQETSNELISRHIETLKPLLHDYLFQTKQQAQNLRQIRKLQQKPKPRSTLPQELPLAHNNWFGDIKIPKMSSYKFIPSHMRRLQHLKSAQLKSDEQFMACISSKNKKKQISSDKWISQPINTSLFAVI